MDLLDSYGIFYVIRTRASTKVFVRGEWRRLQTLRFVTNSRRRNVGQVRYCESHPHRAWVSLSRVKDQNGKPITDAEVDVWHSSPEGFYEQQDPKQAPMNLRGKFMTDLQGHFSFRSVKPAGYPIPIDGPVGDLVRATGRHNYRPAHLHFLIFKEGFKTLISQVYVNDDDKLETDVQFGVTRALVGNYVRHNGPAPASDVKGEWYSLDQTFVMETGKSRLPKPPSQ